MEKNQLIKALSRPKYGFQYFKAIAEQGRFFVNAVEIDLNHKYSDTFLFNCDTTKVFMIKDSPKFKECYDAVTMGEGNESRKISSIRSSSLLGLLAFYKIHLGKILNVNLRINGESVHFVFSEVLFEKTNRVFHPCFGRSSIDIALKGTANDQPCVLYLESKFTEYLEQKDLTKDKKGVCPISWAYEKNKDYSKIFDNTSLDIKPVYYEDKGIELRSKSNSMHYCEGIKQMISHYIGATHSDDLYEGYKVYLGTILFDFSNSNTKNSVDDSGIIIDDYRKQYSILAKQLNSLKDKPYGLIVLEDIITYQELFSLDIGYELDERVRSFYSL